MRHGLNEMSPAHCFICPDALTPPPQPVLSRQRVPPPSAPMLVTARLAVVGAVIWTLSSHPMQTSVRATSAPFVFLSPEVPGTHPAFARHLPGMCQSLAEHVSAGR